MAADFIDALRPLFDCLTDGFCIADVEGRLLYANAAAGKLLGPAANAAGKTSICDLLCTGLGGSCGEIASSCPLKIPRGPTDALTFVGRYRPSGRDLRVCCRACASPDREAFSHHRGCLRPGRGGAASGGMAPDARARLPPPLTIMYGVLRAVEDLGVGHAR